MPQDTQRTNALLEALLSRALTPAEIAGEIDGLIQDHLREDIHLEYKRGNALERGAETPPPQLLREYVGGFANSAGGIFMVGIDAPEEAGADWQVTGCRAPGGGSLADWASRSLTPIAGYISPPAVPYEVPHPDGPVLVVAVARSPTLVPCFDRGDRRPQYHLRLGDQTLAADEYLVADLVLGRREHAYLHVRLVGTMHDSRQMEEDGYFEWWFSPRVQVENEGLDRAANVRGGIVNFSGRRARHWKPISAHLLQHVTVVEPDQAISETHQVHLCHHVFSSAVLEAFTEEVLTTTGVIAVPLKWQGGSSFARYEWKGAMYVTAQGTPPVWYQLSIDIDTPLLVHLEESKRVTSEEAFFRLERLAAGRPVVGWVGPNI